MIHVVLSSTGGSETSVQGLVCSFFFFLPWFLFDPSPSFQDLRRFHRCFMSSRAPGVMTAWRLHFCPIPS